MKKRLVIIDGNAIIHRAYHAIPPLTVKDGTIVNAVYGFTSMLLKVLEDLEPSHLAVSFDVAGKTFRDEIYEDYKATRTKADQDLYDQIPLVYEVVEAFDIPIYTKEGYEADDVIGTVSREVADNKTKYKEVDEVMIVTGDMDMLQLVDDGVVKVYELRKGLSDIVIFDDKKVIEKYGFGPEMIVEYKALRGDASDNIPGVKGVGEKTAKLLIEKIGGIKEIYKDLKSKNSKIREEFKPGIIKKLEEGEDSAKMSKELATIAKSVKGIGFKIADCEFAAVNLERDKIKSLFTKLEFFSLLKRVPGFKQEGKKTKKQESKSGNKKTKCEVISEDNLNDFLKQIENEEEFVCREIIDGKNILESSLLGLVFVFGGQSFYIDLSKVKSKNKIEKNIFGDEKKLLIGHDLKQLVKALQLENIEVKNKLFDVMVASYVVNSSNRNHDLKSLALRELGAELPEQSDQGSLFGVDPNLAAGELQIVSDLYEKLAKDLEDFEDRGMFDDLEMDLIPVLSEMELNGIAVDTKRLEELSKHAADKIKKLTKKIHKEAGEEFNVASSVQLREILFEKMDLPTEGIKKGKTGYSTAASELEKLRGVHPIIKNIEEFREIEKLRNTYIDVLPTLINKKTGRIHTSFNQTVAATGRLSSSDPNLQNIPIRTELGREVRTTFVAEPGYTLLAADYSQIELRIVASLAEDKKLLEIFTNKEDVHTATAAAINGVKPEEVTKEMRYAAKEVNFGVLYGMGSYGLSWRAGIPQWQAKEFIDKYFREFSGVKNYLDQTIKFVKKEGYAETLFGRRRQIPELQSSNYQLRAAGERMAVNMPIQGTAADLMKLAMIEVHKNLKAPARKAGGLKHESSDVKMILQVHDELVLEVKKGMEKEIGELVRKAMVEVAKLRVPIEVNVSFGKRWGELK